MPIWQFLPPKQSSCYLSLVPAMNIPRSLAYNHASKYWSFLSSLNLEALGTRSRLDWNPILSILSSSYMNFISPISINMMRTACNLCIYIDSLSLHLKMLSLDSKSLFKPDVVLIHFISNRDYETEIMKLITCATLSSCLQTGFP